MSFPPEASSFRFTLVSSAEKSPIVVPHSKMKAVYGINKNKSPTLSHTVFGTGISSMGTNERIQVIHVKPVLDCMLYRY